MKLSVIVPVYNEVHTIQDLIKAVQMTGLADEIVMVDDSSTDGSSEILQRLSKQKGVKLLSHEKNQSALAFKP
jgi:glycosyltransferase involved in cell wall biosynthesis